MKTLSYILGHSHFELDHYLALRRDRKLRRRAFRARYGEEVNNSNRRALTWLAIMLTGCVTALLLTFR
jgi:hypothetical protein